MWSPPRPACLGLVLCGWGPVVPPPSLRGGGPSVWLGLELPSLRSPRAPAPCFSCVPLAFCARGLEGGVTAASVGPVSYVHLGVWEQDSFLHERTKARSNPVGDTVGGGSRGPGPGQHWPFDGLPGAGARPATSSSCVPEPYQFLFFGLNIFMILFPPPLAHSGWLWGFSPGPSACVL